MEWFAKKIDDTGDITGKGFINTLGRPSLENLEVMIREAAQNSWDAKKPEVSSINFNITVNEYSQSQLDFLKNTIFIDAPRPIPNLENFTNLGKDYFIIQDQKTEGLTGPVRATQKKKDEPSDYIDFILNLGAPRDKDYGGGTYGYGKTSFHKVSKISTIFVFTKTIYNKKISTRLIGYCLGNGDEEYSGRCWFGNKMDVNAIDPFFDEEAIKIAKKLGFSDTETEETGTSIMIPFPETGASKDLENKKSRSSYEAFIFMLSAVYWNLWPKMINFEDHSNPPIKFKAYFQNKEYALFHPSEHPQIAYFVQAYYFFEQLKKDKKNEKIEKNIIVETIRHNQLKIDTGILSTIGHPDIEKINLEKNDFKNDLLRSIYENSPTNKNQEIKTHHIALMRSTELVIKYFEGPEKNDGNYSGVFIATRSKKVDDAFSESEPPTHDNWAVDQLIGDNKRIVHHTFNKIKSSLKEMIGTEEIDDTHNENFDTLLDLSYLLGNLIAPTISGYAPSRKYKTINPVNKVKKIPKAIIHIDKNANLSSDGTKNFIKVNFTAKIDKRIKSINIQPFIKTCIDSKNIEISPPINSLQPKFLYWIDHNNKKIEEFNHTIGHESSGKTWSVVIETPKNLSVAVDVEIA